MSNLAEIEILLKDALSNEKEVNTKASNSLNKLALENLSNFLQSLGKILCDDSKPTDIRQLSAILMKNSLLYVETLQNEWKNKLSNEDKQNIKMLVLSSLASSFPEIRTSSSSVVASISKIDQPITQNWPDLIISLTKNSFNNDINLKLAAIETLGFVCEELNAKNIDTQTVDLIMNALIENLNNTENDIKVIKQCLKSICFTVKIAEKNFSTEKEMNSIMNSIFLNILNHSNDDDILEKIAIFFIEFLSVSNNYDYINDYFSKLMEFSYHLISEKFQSNQKLSLLGMEILCTIGDEELNREPNENFIVIKQSINGLQIDKPKKISKKYFNKIYNQLQQMIIRFVKVPNEDEDESEWNLSKGCLYILSVLVRVADKENVEKFLELLSQQIKQCNNDDEHCKCWYLLASCLNTHYKNNIYNIIKDNYKTILEDISNLNNIKIQKSGTYLLNKITKYYPKLFGDSKLSVIFGSCIAGIKSKDSFVVSNICRIIQNIIKIYGDKETNKSSNSISQFFENLVLSLFVPAENELANENINLALTRLITIGCLIEYSSHDKQEKIKEILIKILQEIEKISKNNLNYNKEKVYQLEEYYYTLLRIIFKKYKSKIDKDLGKNIWILTKNLFTERKSVFEEANLALGALALNMDENFAEIFKEYYDFIEFSIKSFNISNLCKSGLSVLLNSIRAINNTAFLSEYSERILKVLIEVCTSNDVNRFNKTIAITCIGEVSMVIGMKFQIFLNDIMELLFSACQMGININTDDEDTIDFVKELRYELIQTFTCIEFALEENNKLLVPFVPKIFIFFKQIVNDKVCQRAEILKSMLSFVCDMIKTYGNEMKVICEQQFASDLLNNLKSYQINQYKAEINEQEEILKMLYRN